MSNDVNQNPKYARIVDVIEPAQLAHLGVGQSVPVFEMVNVADQRKWCRATQAWLERGQVPANGCPTRDLLEDGVCRRSPSGGKCLLLLPFNHPDWKPALREEYVEGMGFMLRDEPAQAPVGRQPIALEVLER
ncbi:MAG: hypothetical protein AAF702_28920 [Chloroflexota bacterium]